MKKRIPQSIVLLAITTLFWYPMYVHIPFQTPYLTGIGVASGTVGFIIGCYGLTQIISRLPFGWITDTKGRFKPFWCMGCAFAVTGCLLRIFVPNAAGYTIANLFSGMAAGCWNQYIVCYTGLFPKERMAVSTGEIIMANNLGILLGFVGGIIHHDSCGMKTVCLTGAVLGGIGLLLALTLNDEINKNPAPLGRSDLFSVLKNPRVIIFGTCLLIQQGLVSATANGFTTQVAKNLGGNGLQIGSCSVIYILSGVIFAKMNSGQIHQKLGSIRVISGIFLLQVLYCVLVPNLRSVYAVMAANILAGISQGWMVAAATAEGMRGVRDEIRSTAMGYFGAIYGTGMMLFPMMTGSINGRFGMHAAYYVLGGICLLAAGGVLIYGKKNQ